MIRNHGAMKPDTRQQEIIGRLAAIQKEWKVEELAEAMRVSPITIRRDLESLYKQGAIIRTLGGCLIDNRRRLAAYHDRVSRNFNQKQAIGRAAAKEIKPGQVILINDGSTTFQLASCLGQCGHVTVYTNSVVMIGEIGRFQNVRLNVLGGQYHADLFYLGGALMERVMEKIFADVAFIGADAVGADGNCYCLDEDVARVTWLMTKHARRRILLADHAKLDAKAPVRFANLKDFDLWITSKGLKRNALNKLRKMTRINEADGGLNA